MAAVILLSMLVFVTPFAAAAASGSTTDLPTAAAPKWDPALLSSESLYNGTAVRLRYTDGITIVASTGAKVIFKESGTTVAADGRHVHKRAVELVDPHIFRRSSSTIATATAAYKAAGRSVYNDALAAGFSAAQARQQSTADAVPADEPPIFASGCIHSEDTQPDPDFSWDGCYKWYDAYAESADGTTWYVAGSGTAHGWGTGVFGGGKELDKGYSQIKWIGTGAEIVDASPDANRSGNSNCGNFTIGLDAYITLAYSTPLCDDGWNVTWNGAVHKVEWHGASAGGDSDSRSASGASTVGMPVTTDTVKGDYEIGWTYSCFFC